LDAIPVIPGGAILFLQSTTDLSHRVISMFTTNIRTDFFVNFFLPLIKNHMATLTLNDIIKEMKDIPVDRLEELYQFIHSMTPTTKHSERLRKKILSFGGAFSDMSSNDYSDFLNQTKKTRTELFHRSIDL
jgi:hypothetical protein